MGEIIFIVFVVFTTIAIVVVVVDRMGFVIDIIIVL